MYQILHQPRNVPELVTEIICNQSRLIIDLIDINGARVCKHLQFLKMGGENVVAVSKEENGLPHMYRLMGIEIYLSGLGMP